MEQHLHPQCFERVLCLSNYIHSGVPDYSDGEESSRERNEEERCRNASFKKQKYRKGERYIPPFFLFLLSTHMLSHKQRAPSSKKQHEKQKRQMEATKFINAYSLRKADTQSVVQVATTGAAATMAPGDTRIPSCVSQQHVSSAKYALADNKST